MPQLVIPCKSYVRRYLINQFGKTVDLRKNKHYFNYFRLLLKRKICWRNKRFHLKEYYQKEYQKNDYKKEISEVKIKYQDLIKRADELELDTSDLLNQMNNQIKEIEKNKNGKTIYRTYGKSIYKSQVKIFIDDDTFSRFGFDMTATSIVYFNSFVEDCIKSEARLFIFVANSFGRSIFDSIRDFQNVYGFSEDDFPFETIKQDFQRHKNIFKDFDKILGQSVLDLGQNVSKQKSA